MYTDNDGKATRVQVRDSRLTTLYPYWKTSVDDMKASGISVRIYVRSLRILSFILLIAGILNLPMIVYFWNYANETNKEGILRIVRGSAICDDYDWVFCESCNGEYSDYFPSYRLNRMYAMKNENE